MTIGFMSFFASIISERVSVRAGSAALVPLLAVGIASVFYWDWTELGGSDDLRVYIEVQYLPILAIPLIAFLFPSRYTGSSFVFMVVGLYILARAFELLDAPVFALGHVVSGHFLKHLIAGLAGFVFLRMLGRRTPRSERV